MKRIAMALAALCLLAGGLCAAGCGGKDDGKKESEVLLSGFESVEELLSIGHRYIGKVDFSDEHVTQGERSARFELEGQYLGSEDWFAESTVQWMTGTRFLAKVDYADVVSYELDVYNDSGREVRMLFSVDANPVEECTLKEGENHVSVAVDRRYIGFLLDPSSVTTLELTFEGRSNRDANWVLYLDNFRVRTSAADARAETFDTSTNVLYDFDNVGEAKWKMAVLGAVSSSFTSPVFSVNEDLRYVYTGTTSLMVRFRRNRRGTGIDGVGFRTLTEQVNYDWSQYDEDRTYLEWHLYNATERELTVSVNVYSTKDEVFTTSYTIPAQSWGSYGKERVLLREINEAYTGEGLDVMSIGFVLGGLQNEGDTVYLDGIRFV